MNRTSPPASRRSFKLLITIAVLGGVLAILFAGAFQSEQVLFSNDGPLGVVNSESIALPQAWTGFWMDLYWIGGNGAHSPASFTYGLLWLLKPLGFAKFYGPACLLILGLSAWAFFRTIGLSSSLCTVGGLAAALNSNFFSNTCWGLGTRSLTLACVFLALALLNARRIGNP